MISVGFAQLLAQLRHVHLDGARLARTEKAPHRLQQLRAADDASGLEKQIRQQVELALGELDRQLVHAHLAGTGRSTIGPRESGCSGRGPRRDPAQDGLDAGGQLTR